VGILATEHEDFLKLLARVAPVRGVLDEEEIVAHDFFIFYRQVICRRFGSGWLLLLSKTMGLLS
jgi:hypothetical protein